MAKNNKKRVELRKNRTKPPRVHQWTRDFQVHGFTDEATLGDERVRAKGDLSRKRTIIQNDAAVQPGQEASALMPSVDPAICQPGRVLRVHGLSSVVQTDPAGCFVVPCGACSSRSAPRDATLSPPEIASGFAWPERMTRASSNVSNHGTAS